MPQTYKYTQPWYTTLSIFNQSLVCLPTCRFISLLLIVTTQREVFQCKIMVLPHIVNSQNQIPFLTLLFFSVLWFWGTLNVKQKQLLRNYLLPQLLAVASYLGHPLFTSHCKLPVGIKSWVSCFVFYYAHLILWMILVCGPFLQQNRYLLSQFLFK